MRPAAVWQSGSSCSCSCSLELQLESWTRTWTWARTRAHTLVGHAAHSCVIFKCGADVGSLAQESVDCVRQIMQRHCFCWPSLGILLKAVRWLTDSTRNPAQVHKWLQSIRSLKQSNVWIIIFDLLPKRPKHWLGLQSRPDSSIEPHGLLAIISRS